MFESRKRRGRPRKEEVEAREAAKASALEVLADQGIDMELGAPQFELVGAREFTGADGTEDHWRDVHWVYNNLWVKGVKACDAPSPGAWFWLMECRGDRKALEDFRAYYMKLAPSRKELDERARRADGGESVVDLLAQIEGVLADGEKH